MIKIPAGPIDSEPLGAITTPGLQPVAPEARQALLQALDGVELGEYDERIIDWLSGWEPQVVATVASWILRARRQPQE